jgi:uncharacterized membrane protein YfcA
MMGTSVSVVATVVVVALGRWAKDKQVDMKFVVGSGVYAALLSLVGSTNQKFAEQLGLLVLVTAFLIYIRDISSALGFTRRGDERAPRSLF